MKLSQIGEWKLIDFISKKFKMPLPPGTLGIGDDTAVIPWNETTSQLVTTDILIEGTHFLREAISPQDLGHKSLAVNLSDIAAKGGTPTAAFLSLGLPSDLSTEWLEAFFEGFYQLAKLYNLPLLGGDTTESKKEIVINVCLLGQIQNQFLKLRSGAKTGDIVCVTGFLGDSAAGLRLLLEKKSPDFNLISRHHHPIPHLPQGQWLAGHTSVHAMMDISDGLKISAEQMAKKSNCGFEIQLDQLPVSEELQKAAIHYSWDSRRIAAAGGEDYCLLATLAEKDFPEIQAEYHQIFQQPLFAIGKITSKENCVEFFEGNRPFTGSIESWNHFQLKS